MRLAIQYGAQVWNLSGISNANYKTIRSFLIEYKMRAPAVALSLFLFGAFRSFLRTCGRCVQVFNLIAFYLAMAEEDRLSEMLSFFRPMGISRCNGKRHGAVLDYVEKSCHLHLALKSHF